MVLAQHASRSLDLVGASHEVGALAFEHSAAAERNRRLDADVVSAIVDAGFARHFVPRACGGTGGTFVELTEAVSIVGRGCASSAWCASLFANLSRMAGFLPVEGYQRIWADGPDAIVVGSLIPAGKAEWVGDGWRLSGTWPYISGVDFSDWALLCGNTVSSSGPEPLVFAVPRACLQVEDSWFSVGMAATGSNTVTVDDVAVPVSMAFKRSDLFAGRALGSSEPCHNVPLLAANGLSFVTPMLGSAQGALSHWSAYVGAKIRNYAEKPVGPAPNRSRYELTLARCSGEIDAAELLLHRASQLADRGSATTTADTAQNCRDTALAVEFLTAAVNRLFISAGTNAQTTANPLQRSWRDVNSASTHIALSFDTAAATYAETALDPAAAPAGR
ncbi:hydrolase [Nocardia transvalensis]|nr:hydrolase [Nocardia transvalensis]